MIRTNRKFQSKGLYVSNSPVSGVSGVTFHGLSRIQSIDFDLGRNRESVGQGGQLAPLARPDTAPPTINGTFSYYSTNARNEQLLGFVVDGSTSFISGLLSRTEAEKN